MLTKRLLMLGLVLVALCCFFAPNASTAGEWNLCRNTSNGACSVQPADAVPQLGVFLAKHPSRKEACQDALDRHTDDATDGMKCFAYTAGTKNECKQDGIDLPD